MKNEILTPQIKIEDKILVIRGQHVMIDRDLAELYGVETKRLNEQVRRNIERFPEEFCFQLNKEEFENWRSQFATSNSDCSFAWGLGLNTIFKEKFVVIATIGGDAGSGHAKNAIFFPNSKSKKGLYSHHEFITLEIGFRL